MESIWQFCMTAHCASDSAHSPKSKLHVILAKTKIWGDVKIGVLERNGRVLSPKLEISSRIEERQTESVSSIIIHCRNKEQSKQEGEEACQEASYLDHTLEVLMTTGTGGPDPKARRKCYDLLPQLRHKALKPNKGSDHIFFVFTWKKYGFKSQICA